MPCLWYFQWFTVLFLAATVVAGGAYRVYRKRTGAPSAVPEKAVPEAAV
ncbi:hypothetical protein ACIBW9_28730 [Streptomyces sp. NPDC049541]